MLTAWFDMKGKIMAAHLPALPLSPFFVIINLRVFTTMAWQRFFYYREIYLGDV